MWRFAGRAHARPLVESDAATRRHGDTATRRHGDTAIGRHGERRWDARTPILVGRKTRRAHDLFSWIGLIAPVLSHSQRWGMPQDDSKPKAGEMWFHVGGVPTAKSAGHNGSKPAPECDLTHQTISAPSFSPYHMGVRASHRLSPRRPFAVSAFHLSPIT